MWIAIGALATASSLAACSNEEATSAEPTGPPRILYVQSAEGYGVIWSISPDGDEPAQLTGSPPRNSDATGSENPAWSPDGTRIAYVSSGDSLEEEQTDREIYVMQADGSGSHRLTNDHVLDSSPAWSPDGSQLAFTHVVGWDTDEMDGVIVVMNADGDEVRQITLHEEDGGFVLDTAPSWLPDGSLIAFTRLDYAAGAASFDDVRADIYTVDPSGFLDPRLLIGDGANAKWSPDGTRIVFMSTRDKNGQTCFHDCSENSEIYVADADGTNLRRLTTNEAEDEAPTWSPDGRQILFVSDRSNPEEEYGLYVMDASGGEPRLVTEPNGSWNRDPDWR